ncbi:MAG: right-handed parallel beta-helix repeat-containing protein [Planctomycetes bacterium]|nr:right-handed parallel beta-helix repeat-containing protein [Planctomycetota bacterium]
MNRRTTVPILLACAFALLAPPPALADYLGLEVVERSDLEICKDQTEPYIPFKLDVCDVHVVFDNPDDRLISTAFCDGSTTDPAGFFQHPLGGNTAPACGLIPLFPTLVCDSFVTLGLECDRGGSTTDPDFDSTAFNTSGEVSGGWYNSAPSNGQGAPDANGRVLIGRFSYKQNKNTTGEVCVFTKLAGSDDIVEFLLKPFDCSNPGMQSSGGGCLPGTTRYVDDSATGNNSGISWMHAYTDLQSALDVAASGDQIWVAAGTYKPTKPVGARAETFALANCLEIYGGFAGTEMDLSERDWLVNETILSGDIGIPINVSDNSYHVVSAGSSSSVDATAILDGFTVTAGNANGAFASQNGPDQGSGVNIWTTSTPQLVNCTFRDNWSYNHGAVNDHGGASISNCVFKDNQQTGLPSEEPPFVALGGAGLYIHGDTASMVTSCRFLNNSSVADGGGVYIARSFDPTPTNQATLSNCIFSENVARKGGAMYINDASSPLIENCTVVDNHVNAIPTAWGAAMNIEPLCEAVIRNCQFIDNSPSPSASGYGGVYTFGKNTRFINCLFLSNSARNGSAIYLSGADAHVDATNCLFLYNLADSTGIPTGFASGAAIIADTNRQNSSVNVTNSLFVGNRTIIDVGDAYGGAIHIIEGSLTPTTTLTATNCTFVSNKAENGLGGAIFLETTGNKIDNCMFWDNTDGGPGGESAQIYLDTGAAVIVGYTDIQGLDLTKAGPFCQNPGGTPPCEGNINADPIFVSGLPSGNWTAGVYCCPTCTAAECENAGLKVGQTKLTDANANGGQGFTDDEFLGKFLNPDTGQALETLIVSNTATELLVWGDFEAAGTSGASYQLNDYHLQPGPAGSPCIDAADNNATGACDLDLDGKERFVNDPGTEPDPGVPSPEHPLDIVDMGAYEFGGDPELDCDGNALADSCCPADFDGDAAVGAFDLATLLGTWGDCPEVCIVGVSTCECRADLDNNCDVAAFDLAQLLGNWGPCL